MVTEGRAPLRASIAALLALLIALVCVAGIGPAKAHAASYTSLSATVAEPLDVADPSYTATAGASGYTASVTKWYKGGTVQNPGSEMQSGVLFIKGQIYIAEVKFTTNSGNTIPSTPSIKINGNSAFLWKWGTNAAWGRYAFVAGDNPSAISAPNARITEPVELVLPSLTAIPERSSYTTKVKWYRGGTVQSPGDAMPATSEFHYDSTYIAEVTYTAKDGYRFSSDAKPQINGREAYLYGWSQTGLKARYAFKASADPYAMSALTANVTAPAFPNSPVYTASTIDSGYTVSVSKWYAGGTVQSPRDVMEASDTFENGSTYIAELKFTAAEGKKFSGLISAMVNGTDAYLYGWSPSSLIIRQSFVAGVDANTVLGGYANVTAPVVGVVPNYEASSLDHTYTVEVRNWYKGGTVTSPGTKMSSTEVFKPGNTYIAEVKFTAASGYSLYSSFDAQINGKDAYLYGWNGPNVIVRYAFTTVEDNPDVISSVAASVADPEAGDVPAAVATTSSSDYTVEVRSWHKGGTVASPGDKMEAGDKFEAGATYILELKMTAASGKQFLNGVAVEINGKKGYFYGWNGPVVVVRQAFTVADAVPQVSFTDVPEDSWFYKPVAWAVSKGITSGTSATTFSPDATCTRAQAVTFLWNAAGQPAPKSSAMPFTDVADGAWYRNAVLWAVEQGITSGTSATTFSPDATCTRAQIVTFLWNSESKPTPGSSACPFVDVPASAWYRTSVLWAVENGVTSGTSATTFSPDANCTRAQIVTFMYNYMAD